MNRRTRALPTSVLALVMLAFVGCGGASTDSSVSTATRGRATTDTTASSRTSTRPAQTAAADAHFVARADAVCRRANAEITSVQAKSSSPKEVERIVPRNVALEREGIARLAKLAPPPSLQVVWRSMLGYRRTLAAELTRLLDAAKAKDATAIKSLTVSKRSVHKELSKLATAHGFKDCAKVGAVG
jgi:hypothetical protein